MKNRIYLVQDIYSSWCNCKWDFFPLSESLLLTYRNTMDLCIFILILQLYWIHWWVLIGFFYFGGILGFFIYSIMLPIIIDRLFFPNKDSFYFLFFSCHTSVPRTSNTILNKSGKSGYPCFVIDLLFITECVSCQLVIYGFHYTEVCSFYPLSGDFCHKRCWTFSQDFSASIEMTISFNSSVC